MIGDAKSQDYKDHRPIDSAGWLVPSDVEYDQRYIYWRARLVKKDDRDGLIMEHPTFPEHMTSGGKDMLESFLQLDPTSPAEIAEFACRWGILGVRRIRLPIPPDGGWSTGSPFRKTWVTNQSDVHNLPIRATRFWSEAAWQELHRQQGYEILQWEMRVCKPWGNWNRNEDWIYGREPLYVWAHWYRRFTAVLRAWDLIGSGNALADSDEWCGTLSIVHDEEYKTAVEEPQEPGELATTKVFASEEEARKYENFRYGLDIERELKEWMAIAGLTLKIQYATPEAWGFGNGEDPRFETTFLRAPKMHFTICAEECFAGLLLQLLARLSGAGGYALCSLCGKVYEPSRQPRPGEMHYCEACRARANTLAVRRHREKKRNLISRKDRKQHDKTRKR